MFVHPDIDPVAVAIGPLAVHWYGLMYLLSFLIGWGLGIGSYYSLSRPMLLEAAARAQDAHAMDPPN